MSAPNLETLVSSRICHDLISPVGAIANGVELLSALTNTMPELDLISDSVENAKAKLQYYRICFGQNSDMSVMGAQDIQDTAGAMLNTNRLSLEWQNDFAPSERLQVKMLYLALLCVEVALPVGGVITVSQSGKTWNLLAKAPRLLEQDIWKVLEWQMPEEPVSPARVQFLLLRNIARDQGRNVVVEFNEDSLALTL